MFRYLETNSKQLTSILLNGFRDILTYSRIQFSLMDSKLNSKQFKVNKWGRLIKIIKDKVITK